MKTIVVHHSADYDGLFCREIARKFLPDAELIGWNYGEPLIPISEDVELLYILDLSPDCVTFEIPSEDPHKRLVWIDHHKTAIDKWDSAIPGYRIDGVAACRLAWQWFTNDLANNVMSDAGYLPEKQEYLNRTVQEPLAVRLAGEYDIWDHRGDGDLEFQFGLRVDAPDIDWGILLSGNGDGFVGDVIDRGRVAMRYAASVDAGMTKNLSFLLEWEGLKFLALNTGRFNSQTFAAKDVPETGHDALLGFNWNGERWTVSLYHASHRKDLDLSEIAKRHGGGGHRGACGFTAEKLDWL